MAGFRVGGKTGTSEDGVNTGKYVTSFMGVAPISDPEVVILITLYNPTGQGGHQGGGVAAPIASQVLTDVLTYLELNKDNVQEEIQEVTVPDIREVTIKEAEKILKENNLEIEIETQEGQKINKDTNKVEEQLPFPGVKVKTGSKIQVRVVV